MGNEILAPALSSLIEEMGRALDPWWIIGSVAVSLHGGDPGEIADIDVIVSGRDLDALYQRLPLTDTPDHSKLMFRSERFGLWSKPELPVEFMARLEIVVDGERHLVQPQTRKAFNIGGATVFAPEREELIAMLHLFGRDKDLSRAATLL